MDVLKARDQEKIEEAIRKLNEVAKASGYLPVATLEELSLTPEQMAQFEYNSLKEKTPNIRYYFANRKDGSTAKLVVMPRTDGDYFAEFFSPDHHGFNHDFSLGEMEGNMKIHLAS